MSTLLDILGNKDLTDDQEIKIGEETYKLGDLREVNSERETLRTEREAIAKERDDFRGRFEKQSATLTELLGDAHKRASEEIERPPEKSPQDALIDSLRALTNKDDGTEALFKDPVFGKALNTVEERAYNRAKKEFDTLATKFGELDENVKKGFEGVTVAQLNARLDSWYGDNRTDIPKGEDGKRMSPRAIHQYAFEHNMVVPGTRLLDYDAALETLTAPAREEARMTEAEKRGYQKGLEAGRRGAAEVIPIFGDRSASGAPGDKISTVGKSAKQLVQEQLQRGLTDIAKAENE